ncbi:MAG: hypothetical protein ABI700_18715 [Chloroflexota bacterium]
MRQNELKLTTSRKLISTVTTLVLWLISAVLALVSIFALRELLFLILTKLLINPDAISNADAEHTIFAANDCSAFIFGIFCLGVIVVTSDYVFKRVGQPRTFRLLIGLIVVECIIVLPVALIFWRT